MRQYSIVKDQLQQCQRTWLITGVAGFIGSNLLEALLLLNQKVVGLDNFSTGYQRNLDEVKGKVLPAQWRSFRFIEGDITRPEDCQQACSGVDYVLHQAALGSIPKSVEDPIAANHNNVDGFLNMLTAARDAGVRRLVYASSCAVYGDHPALAKTEQLNSTPLSPYAVTKCVNELYADTFARCYGFKTIGLRYFNIFGPRQDANGAYAAVIPQWITQMLLGQMVKVYGDGETSRDFCYIDNVVQANLLAALTQHEPALNQVYNIAVQESTTLNQLFGMIRDQLTLHRPAVADYQVIYQNFRVGDVRQSLADISKARELLAYRPTHRTAEGLAQAMAWYIAQVASTTGTTFIPTGMSVNPAYFNKLA